MTLEEWKRLQLILRLQTVGEVIFSLLSFIGLFAIILAPTWLPACIDRFNP